MRWGREQALRLKLTEDETGSEKTGASDGGDLVYKMVSQVPEPCKALFSGATLSEWQEGYRKGEIRPCDLLDTLQGSSGDPAWITPLDEGRLCSQVDELAGLLDRAEGDISRLPLYGVPFAVKDNIDVAGWPTTAGCPDFAYVPRADAAAVRRLREAGAIVVGKTNLDQFATGLVGTRSPYGIVPNTFRPEYISGGSSSGSASVVARGLVPFALGTDTAGSGRVPAGFNNIVGLKPTRGWFSTSGVVPACRTLDCVSIMALTVADAECVASIMAGFDESDPYSRLQPATAPLSFPEQLRIAVPSAPEFFGDAEAAAAFGKALDAARALGAQIVPIDFTPFLELATMLYNGPWVAERLAAVSEFLKRQPSAVHPTVLEVIGKGLCFSAADFFKAEYHRAELARRIAKVMSAVDALLVPTAPRCYTIPEILADPIALNARLGIYTNFANFADLSALALCAGFRSDGLPAGITILAPAWHDRALTAFGRCWEQHYAGEGATLGATGRRLIQRQTAPLPAQPGTVRLAVVGAHLRGMPLNRQLTSLGAAFVEATSTSPTYRLLALARSHPAKPGLLRVRPGEHGGGSIAVELWDVPSGALGSLLAEIPPPLGIGTLELEDGRLVKGFICEYAGLADAKDITSFGSWRAYLAGLVE
jgi:allophanate hydrolase